MPTKKLRKTKNNIRLLAQIDLMQYLIDQNKKFIKVWEQKLTHINNSTIEAIDPITYIKIKTNEKQIKHNLIYANQEILQLEIMIKTNKEKLDYK